MAVSTTKPASTTRRSAVAGATRPAAKIPLSREVRPTRPKACSPQSSEDTNTRRSPSTKPPRTCRCPATTRVARAANDRHRDRAVHLMPDTLRLWRGWRVTAAPQPTWGPQGRNTTMRETGKDCRGQAGRGARERRRGHRRRLRSEPQPSDLHILAATHVDRRSRRAPRTRAALPPRNRRRDARRPHTRDADRAPAGCARSAAPSFLPAPARP